MLRGCAAVFFAFIYFTDRKVVNAYEPVETIIDVEATANSLIVHTDAAGGTAGLRILIEVFDLAANEQQLKTVDLSGPLLENTRGWLSDESISQIGFKLTCRLLARLL